MESQFTNAGQSSSPADIAQHLERLPEDQAREYFRQLEPAVAAAVLAELEIEDAINLLETLPDERVASLLQLVPRTNTADLIGAFPEARRAGILAGLAPEKEAAVTNLLQYPPQSAGGIMDNRFVAVRDDDTVDQCLARLRSTTIRATDDVLYIYVTDAAQKLVGVIALRDLTFSPGHRLVRDIMNPNVRFLRATDDQEEIARLIRNSTFMGFPVVDESHRLVGVVRMRDAIRVAQAEATEDMQLMVGLSGEEHIWTRWHSALGKRLPWLGVNMFTTLLAAAVVSYFETTIAQWAALVMFLPMISAVGGNAGMQALTVVVRGMAVGEVTRGDAFRAMRKELAIGLVNGFVLGVAIGLLALGWKHSLVLGVVAATAMMLNQMVGTLSGVAVPFGLRRLGVDPALASSIFVTTITDVIGFLVFLGFAAATLRLVH